MSGKRPLIWLWGKGDAAVIMLERIFGKVASFLSISTRVVMILMVASVCYDATMRYVFAAPTSWSQEVNAFLMVYLALVPAADVARGDGHMNITFFIHRLSDGKQAAGRLLVALAGFALSAVMVRHGFAMMHQAWVYGARMSSTLGTPMYLPYALIPVGFGLLAIFFFFSVVSNIRNVGNVLRQKVSPDRPLKDRSKREAA